jgi:endoglucanase
MKKAKYVSLLALAVLLASCSAPMPAQTSAPAQTISQATAAATTSAAPTEEPMQYSIENTGLHLLKGVNLGDCLEAPNEGDWGHIIQKEWFEKIREAGFDHVRRPVSWSTHAAEEAPYAIDPVFQARVDEILGWALEQGLAVVLDIHHFNEYIADPDGQRARLCGIWANLAEHYKDMPDSVLFELLNEPNGKADFCANQDTAALIELIRKTNPVRWLIVDANHWANLTSIVNMKLPEDQRLIASVHMYEPFQFTHQGASWVEGSDAWLGTKWEGTDKEKQDITDLLNIVSSMQKKLGVPVYLGEFGAYSRADYGSRVRWTSFIARQCEKRGFGWAYWEFCSGFGVYDETVKQYDSGLLKALIPPGQ